MEYRYALGEISESSYRVAIDKLNQSIAESEQKLRLHESNFSNTLRIAHQAVLMSCQLASYWKEGNFKNRQKLQKIAFPMGIKYDKEKGISRTLCVNEVFRVIRSISDDYTNKNTKSDFDLSSKSPYVEKIDELSDSFFQDLQVIEDFLKPSPESIFHS